MGIKHIVTKSHGDRGYASEWNDDHIIDSDIDFAQYEALSFVVENRVGYPAGPVQGQLIYRTDKPALEIFDGVDWDQPIMADGSVTYTGDQDFDQNELINPVIDSRGVAPAGPVAGQMYWDTTVKQMFFYNDDAAYTDWRPMGPSPDVVVALDGTGDVDNLADALAIIFLLGGGWIHIKPGTYDMNAGVHVVSDDVKITGSGEDTMLRFNAAVDNILVTSNDNFTIRDCYIVTVGSPPGALRQLYINGTQQVRIENCRFNNADGGAIRLEGVSRGYITGNYIHSADNGGIHVLNGCEDIYVSDNAIYVNYGYCLNTGGTTNYRVYFTNNTCYCNSQNNIDLDGVDTCIVTGNHCSGNIHTYGLHVETTCSNVTVSKNVFLAGSNDCVRLYADGVKFEGNVIRDAGFTGLLIEGSYITANDNYIYNSGEYAIECDGQYCTMDGNLIDTTGDNAIWNHEPYSVISNNIIKNAGGHAIHNTSEKVVIVGNYIYDAGLSGIYTGVSGEYAVITGNYVEGTSGDGIYVVEDHCTVTGNIVNDAGDEGIFVSSNHVTVSSNTIDNPTDYGIYVTGSYGCISENAISNTGDDGIRTTGDHLSINSNSVYNCSGDGIDIEGDDCTVIGNAIDTVTESDIENTGANNDVAHNT